MDAQLNQSRVASVLMLLTGIWIATSPIWISVTGGVAASLIAAGSAIGLAGIVQFFTRSALPSWAAGLAAVWLLVSTLVFDMSDASVWNHAIVAGVTLLLAFWDGFEITQVQHSHAQPTL